MKTKQFILLCFSALLLIFVVPIEPSKDVKKIGKTEESKTSIEVDCYAYWSGRSAIWKGGEGGKNEWCGGGKGGGGGKGYNTLVWRKVKSRGTEWWKGGKGSGNRNVGGGGYIQPIPSGGNGAGGGNVKNIPSGVNEGGSGKGENGENFIELPDNKNMTYSGKAGSGGMITGALSSMVNNSTEN